MEDGSVSSQLRKARGIFALNCSKYQAKVCTIGLGALRADLQLRRVTGVSLQAADVGYEVSVAGARPRFRPQFELLAAFPNFSPQTFHNTQSHDVAMKLKRAKVYIICCSGLYTCVSNTTVGLQEAASPVRTQLWFPRTLPSLARFANPPRCVQFQDRPPRATAKDARRTSKAHDHDLRHATPLPCETQERDPHITSQGVRAPTM